MAAETRRETGQSIAYEIAHVLGEHFEPMDLAQNDHTVLLVQDTQRKARQCSPCCPRSAMPQSAEQDAAPTTRTGVGGMRNAPRSESAQQDQPTTRKYAIVLAAAATPACPPTVGWVMDRIRLFGKLL
jgi:hypothetical protein